MHVCPANATRASGAVIRELVNQIASTDREIDLRVYRLYGLNYEEVKIVDPDTPIIKNEYDNEKLV